MYDILKAMGKDAEKENKKELANTWRKIKSDRSIHVNLLKDALEKEIHSG